MVIGILGFLLFTLLPVVLVIVLLSRWMAGRLESDLDDGEPEDEGIGAVRRLFIYASHSSG